MSDPSGATNGDWDYEPGDVAASYAECTCGHYWDHHDEAGCEIVGCGCRS